MSPSTHSRPLILIVEDDVGVREFLTEAFTAESYRTVSVSRAISASDVARTNPDAIVLELLVAGADSGSSLLRELHADHETSQVPVVICTGAPKLLEQEPDVGALASAVVIKPFDLDELLGAIETALAGSLRPPRGAQRVTRQGPATAR
jgi:DNA-binding response OmpR family regulator